MSRSLDGKLANTLLISGWSTKRYHLKPIHVPSIVRTQYNLASRGAGTTRSTEKEKEQKKKKAEEEARIAEETKENNRMNVSTHHV